MELIIIVLGFILDRVTKVMAFDALGGGYEKQIIKGIFSLEYYENTGAAFSMLSTKTMLLAFVSLIILDKSLTFSESINLPLLISISLSLFQSSEFITPSISRNIIFIYVPHFFNHKVSN